jgi:hypothetical protein
VAGDAPAGGVGLRSPGLAGAHAGGALALSGCARWRSLTRMGARRGGATEGVRPAGPESSDFVDQDPLHHDRHPEQTAKRAGETLDPTGSDAMAVAPIAQRSYGLRVPPLPASKPAAPHPAPRYRVHPHDTEELGAALEDVAAGRMVELTPEELEHWEATGELPKAVKSRFAALECNASRS